MSTDDIAKSTNGFELISGKAQISRVTRAEKHLSAVISKYKPSWKAFRLVVRK